AATNERQHGARIAGEVQHGVDAARMIRPYLGSDVGGVVHDFRGAECGHETPSLITARRRDHPRADLRGELYGDGTDASRCPHDENRLAAAQLRGVHGEPRRGARETEGATRVEVDRLRQPREADRHRNRYELSE